MFTSIDLGKLSFEHRIWTATERKEAEDFDTCPSPYTKSPPGIFCYEYGALAWSKRWRGGDGEMESEERKEGSGGGEKEGVGWQREYGRRRKLEEEKGTDNKREGGGGY